VSFNLHYVTLRRSLFSSCFTLVPPAIDLLDVPTLLDTKYLPKDTAAGSEVPYKYKGKVRKKRQAPLSSTKIEPELLLFCDNAMVQQFEGDTDELLEYLLHFWHAVSTVYHIRLFGLYTRL